MSIAQSPIPVQKLLACREPVVALLATFGPPELEAIRQAAALQFERLGVPTTKHEEWKYTPLRALEETDFEVAYGANVYRPELKKSPMGSLEAITITFVNGQHAPELSTEQSLPGGAVVCTLEGAFSEYPAIVGRHLASLAGKTEGKLGAYLDAPFVALNTAFLSEGAFVYVPEGVVIEEPIHIQFVSKADQGAFSAHPRSLVVLGDRAGGKVVESYFGLEGAYFNNAVTEVVVGNGAHLEHVKVQSESPEAFHIATTQTLQHGGASYHAVNVNFGGRLSRNDVNLWLDGEHSESRLDGVYVGTDEQHVDNHTRIDHAMPNCNSFEVYKGILTDTATGVFNGKIYVYEDAQKTDAKQTNQALLLSPTATLNTKPQLEIFADDVKCTHGATVGQIREDALFYLRSRGIPKKEAESLLVYAFAAEVLEKINTPGLAEMLERALFAKLGGQEAPKG